MDCITAIRLNSSYSRPNTKGVRGGGRWLLPLDAAVSLLCPDAVVVVLWLEQLGASKIIAFYSSCSSSKPLDTVSGGSEKRGIIAKSWLVALTCVLLCMKSVWVGCWISLLWWGLHSCRCWSQWWCLWHLFQTQHTLKLNNAFLHFTSFSYYGIQCLFHRWSEGYFQSGQIHQSHPRHRPHQCRCRSQSLSQNPVSADKHHQTPKGKSIEMDKHNYIVLFCLPIHEGWHISWNKLKSIEITSLMRGVSIYSFNSLLKHKPNINPSCTDLVNGVGACTSTGWGIRARVSWVSDVGCIGGNHWAACGGRHYAFQYHNIVLHKRLFASSSTYNRLQSLQHSCHLQCLPWLSTPHWCSRCQSQWQDQCTPDLEIEQWRTERTPLKWFWTFFKNVRDILFPLILFRVIFALELMSVSRKIEATIKNSENLMTLYPEMNVLTQDGERGFIPERGVFT